MNMCNWLGWVRCQYFPQVNPRMLPPIGARWSVRCSIICAGTDCIILCIPHINTKTVACQITCIYEILPLNLLLESYKWPLTWYFNPTEQMKQYEWIRRYLYYLQDPVSYVSDYMFDAFCTADCNTPVFGTTRHPVYSPKMCGLHKVYVCSYTRDEVAGFFWHDCEQHNPKNDGCGAFSQKNVGNISTLVFPPWF